eukprot:scaffold699_cov385-Prasinococcus_capsulatus_cf.AAC.29
MAVLSARSTTLVTRTAVQSVRQRRLAVRKIYTSHRLALTCKLEESQGKAGTPGEGSSPSPSAGVRKANSSSNAKESGVGAGPVIPFASVWSRQEKASKVPQTDAESREQARRDEYAVLLKRSTEAGVMILSSTYAFLEAAVILTAATMELMGRKLGQYMYEEEWLKTHQKNFDNVKAGAADMTRKVTGAFGSDEGSASAARGNISENKSESSSDQGTASAAPSQNRRRRQPAPRSRSPQPQDLQPAGGAFAMQQSLRCPSPDTECYLMDVPSRPMVMLDDSESRDILARASEKLLQTKARLEKLLPKARSGNRDMRGSTEKSFTPVWLGTELNRLSDVD